MQSVCTAAVKGFRAICKQARVTHRLSNPSVDKIICRASGCSRDAIALLETALLMGRCFNGHSYLEFEEWLKVNDELTDEQRVMLKLEYG